MINEKTLTIINNLITNCENSINTLENHYENLQDELAIIFDDIDDMLHNKERKKANVVFNGDYWQIDTYNEKNEPLDEFIYDSLIGYPTDYVNDDILNMLEVLIAQDYEISFEYNIKE